jgi:hypothetical protein
VNESIVFVPKYQNNFLFAFLCFFIAVGVSACFVIMNPYNWIAWICLLLFGFLSVRFPFVIFKRITFAEEIYLERYIVGTKVIQYGNVLDIGECQVKTRDG